MNDDNRLGVTALMWITYLGMIWFMVGALGNWAILLAFVLMIPLIVAMAFMWGAPGTRSVFNNAHSNSAATLEREKQKREHLDNILRNLSGEELSHLKQRLEDNVLDDEMLGDDGELVSMDEMLRR